MSIFLILLISIQNNNMLKQKTLQNSFQVLLMMYIRWCHAVTSRGNALMFFENFYFLKKHVIWINFYFIGYKNTLF